MTMKRIRSITAGLRLAAVAWFLGMVAMQGWAQQPQADADAEYATELLKPGQQIPDFQLKTPQGKTVNLSELTESSYVVLDFWASWCPDCRRDMPNVQRMYEEFSQKGVRFVGISFDTESKAWQAAIDKYNIRYAQVSDLKKMRESDVAKAFGVKWIPSMVLVDPQGKVVLSTVLSEKMEKALTETMANEKEN